MSSIFDQPEQLQALFAPPEDPGAEPTANFPLGFYADFLAEINRLGIVVLTYDDLYADSDDWDYQSNYTAEFEHWQQHRRDPAKTYLLIQHDVDNHPHFTKRMVALEHVYGVRSNVFLFRNRFSQRVVDPPYVVDHEFFQQAEQRGFVIGYHQNAFQLAGFDMEAAVQRYREDVAALRELYDVKYVVPHGGVGAEIDGEMMHNFSVPMPEELRTQLRWVFNGHAARFTTRWSDGGMRRMRDPKRIGEYDLIERFLHTLKPGTRNFCLVHPQRWGFNIEVDANPLLAEHEWYQQLCRRYPGVVITRGGDNACAHKNAARNEVRSA